MKTLSFALLAVGFLSFFAGCGHLDLTPPGPADRVLVGVVSNNSNAVLPADAEVTVRVIDLSRGTDKADVLGEQTVTNPGRMPVSFRIEYRAEDALLMRSVNVEARISVGGHLRYTTVSAHPVTLGNMHDMHVVEVVLTGKR